MRAFFFAFAAGISAFRHFEMNCLFPCISSKNGKKKSKVYNIVVKNKNTFAV